MCPGFDWSPGMPEFHIAKMSTERDLRPPLTEVSFQALAPESSLDSHGKIGGNGAICRHQSHSRVNCLGKRQTDVADVRRQINRAGKVVRYSACSQVTTGRLCRRNFC